MTEQQRTPNPITSPTGTNKSLPAAILTTKYKPRRPVDQAKLNRKAQALAAAMANKDALLNPTPLPNGGVVFKPIPLGAATPKPPIKPV